MLCSHHTSRSCVRVCPDASQRRVEACKSVNLGSTCCRQGGVAGQCEGPVRVRASGGCVPGRARPPHAGAPACAGAALARLRAHVEQLHVRGSTLYNSRYVEGCGRVPGVSYWMKYHVCINERGKTASSRLRAACLYLCNQAYQIGKRTVLVRIVGAF